MSRKARSTSPEMLDEHFVVDMEMGQLRCGDRCCLVTRSQMTILLLLARNAGRPVTHDAIIRAVWPDDEPEWPGNTLAAHICMLRHTIRTAGVLNPIGTVWGGGYMFCAAVTVPDPATSISLRESTMRTLRQLLDTHPDRANAAVVAEALA